MGGVVQSFPEGLPVWQFGLSCWCRLRLGDCWVEEPLWRGFLGCCTQSCLVGSGRFTPLQRLLVNLLELFFLLNT